MENNDLKIALQLKDKFANNRKQDQIELAKLRHSLSIELIDKRNTFASKRHSERLEILRSKY